MENNKLIYIFLDIDGVLNSESAFIYNTNLWKKDKNVEIAAVIDEQKLIIFNDFCTQLNKASIDFKIIISSTWRKHEDLLNKIAKSLKKYNLKVDGITPYLSKDRGCEIAKYCKDNCISEGDIIIFDDGNDMCYLSNRLIQTYFRDGLTYIDIEKALVFLGLDDFVWNPERFKNKKLKNKEV